MHKNMWLGKFENYYWFVSASAVWTLADLIKKHHANEILHITAFDSGPIAPNKEEIESGWSKDGKIMISPPLSSRIEIPHEQFDEWYVSTSKLSFPSELEIFVNYGGFTLASPEELTKDDDPTWERGRYDYLYPMHDRFWKQLSIINPSTYVSSGDLDIVVSKNKELINEVENNA
jgi:hypothetical protein